MNAFETYLLEKPLSQAVNYFVYCLMSESTSQAWDLMKEFQGSNWKCQPEHIKPLIEDTLIKLAKERGHHVAGITSHAPNP